MSLCEFTSCDFWECEFLCDLMLFHKSVSLIDLMLVYMSMSEFTKVQVCVTM